MIEQVARAIEAATSASRGLPPGAEDHTKYLVVAYAAIAAMRNPTEAMVEAGYAAPMPAIKNLGAWKYASIIKDYQAMIDSVLTEPDPPMEERGFG